jgi:transcriptional activator SPT8
MIVDEPPSDDFGERERQEAMDEEDDSRSQGSMMDGDPQRIVVECIGWRAKIVATSQISEDESDNENDENENEIENEAENENENENENEDEDMEIDADAEAEAEGDQEHDQSSSPSTPKSPSHPHSTTPPPRIRKRSPPPLQPGADTCASYDIVPVLAAPHATSVNAITATTDMRWVFTGGSDGYIRRFDHFAGMNGKVPLTVAQKHPFVDSVTKVIRCKLRR